MMLNKYDLREKEYIKLEIEYDKILRSKNEYVKLNKPYQKGWKIYVSLKQDILNRFDSNNILQAIKLGFKNFKYVYKIYQIKNIRKKIYNETIVYNKYLKRYISYFPDKIYYKQKTFDNFKEEIKKYFIYDIYKNVYYINLPYYYYVLKSKPNIITHERVLDPEKESRKHYISERMYTLRTYCNNYDNYNKFNKKYNPKKKYKFNFKNY